MYERILQAHIASTLGGTRRRTGEGGELETSVEWAPLFEDFRIVR